MDKAPDPDDLRDNLMLDIIQLHGDFNRLGDDHMIYIPDFLKETRALAVDAQIQKLRKQIDCMRKMKDLNAPSNSTSALVSTSAPSSEEAAQMVALNSGVEKWW